MNMRDKIHFIPKHLQKVNIKYYNNTRCGRSTSVENLELLNFSFITRKEKQMKKIENVYTLKPNYDDPTPHRRTYTGTWMPVDEFWKMLNGFSYEIDTGNSGLEQDKVFIRRANTICAAAICFLHPEIEGIVGGKTLSDVELYALLDKLQDEDCAESEKDDEEEDEEDDE